MRMYGLGLRRIGFRAFQGLGSFEFRIKEFGFADFRWGLRFSVWCQSFDDYL